MVHQYTEVSILNARYPLRPKYLHGACYPVGLPFPLYSHGGLGAGLNPYEKLSARCQPYLVNKCHLFFRTFSNPDFFGHMSSIYVW